MFYTPAPQTPVRRGGERRDRRAGIDVPDWVGLGQRYTAVARGRVPSDCDTRQGIYSGTDSPLFNPWHHCDVDRNTVMHCALY